MNNFFKNIFKNIRIGYGNDENIAKEEEDVVDDVSLNFQIEQLSNNDTLDKLVWNIKINGAVVEK
jgi:hypothetical protein